MNDSGDDTLKFLNTIEKIKTKASRAPPRMKMKKLKKIPSLRSKRINATRKRRGTAAKPKIKKVKEDKSNIPATKEMKLVNKKKSKTQEKGRKCNESDIDQAGLEELIE